MRRVIKMFSFGRIDAGSAAAGVVRRGRDLGGCRRCGFCAEDLHLQGNQLFFLFLSLSDEDALFLFG